MLELLKKLGVPATVAAVVAALVTLVPLFFQVDERYAKEKEVNPALAQIQKQLTDLTDEMGKLAGTEQVLVAIVTSNSGQAAVAAPVERHHTKKMAVGPISVGAASPPPAAAPAASAPAPIAIPKTDDEKKVLLDQVTRGLASTQAHLQTIQQAVAAKK